MPRPLLLVPPVSPEARRPPRGVSPEALADLAMERYVDGDTTAFAALFRFLAPRIYALGLHQTRQAVVAEDLVQQTLLQLHRARRQFTRGARVVPWSLAIARRVLIDGHRRRRLEASFLAERPYHPAKASTPDAEEMVSAKQTARRLEARFRRLPECQRAAFALVKQQGLSHAEAAEALGVTVNAVRVRLHRAYAALRRALRDAVEV